MTINESERKSWELTVCITHCVMSFWFSAKTDVLPFCHKMPLHSSSTYQED